MVRIGTCIACQVGDHKRHTRVMQAVPKGVMGGVVCGCKGECEEDREGRRRDFLKRMGLGPVKRRTEKPLQSDGFSVADQFCCKTMREQLTSTCTDHPDRCDCPDTLVDRLPDSGVIGIVVHDGGSSVVRIDYCPWCAARLGEKQQTDRP